MECDSTACAGLSHVSFQWSGTGCGHVNIPDAPIKTAALHLTTENRRPQCLRICGYCQIIDNWFLHYIINLPGTPPTKRGSLMSSET